MHRSFAMQRGPLVDLNLLPGNMRRRRYPRWYVPGLMLLLVGCVLLVPSLAAVHSTNQETADLRGQLAHIGDGLQGVQLDFGKERALRNKIAETEQAINAVRQERESLPGAGGPLADGLALMTSAAPSGVTVDTVSRSGNALRVSGQADKMESVISYAKAITDDDLFSSVIIWQVEASAKGVKYAIEATR